MPESIPQLSSYLTNTNTVYAQTDYRVNEKLTALFGFRYTNETGFTYNGFTGRVRPTATISATSWKSRAGYGTGCSIR